MRIAYEEKKLSDEKLYIISLAIKVIDVMQAQGYRLTLRQLYYQFIAKDLFPDTWIDPVYNHREGLPLDTKNTEKNYKKLGVILTDGRMNGYIDWEAIEDRTRSEIERTHWESPEAIIRAAAKSYTIDLWQDQSVVPEVWIEKEALAGVFERPCQDHDVLLFPCRGYGSASMMWGAGRRIKERFDETGQETLILHFGDHDPSGIDMTRDIEARLNTFAGWEAFRVERIALSMAQVNAYGPPPNPAKITDPRAKQYVATYGNVSWELDALDASVLEGLVNDHVEAAKSDTDAYQARVEEEIDGQQDLSLVSDNWREWKQQYFKDGEKEDSKKKKPLKKRGKRK